MKIGILTLQGATNYGAVLQVLGLSEYLKTKGHDVEVIDYWTPEVYGFYDYRIFSKPISLRSVASKTLRRFRNEREFKAFDNFRRKYLTFSKRCCDDASFVEVCNSYDAIICGSDQVWNPNANGGHNAAYYLGLLDGSKVRKVSYAASFGNVDCARGLESDIAQWVSDYKEISVRENEAADFMRSLTDVPVSRVIDPSMLLDESDYARYETKFDVPDRFILTYMLQSNDEMVRAVDAASQFTGLPIISLGRRMKDGRFIKDIGPGEFLYLYRKAECVITNSFHGTAFSLLYGKPFVTFGNGKYNSRMETLLGAVGQMNRFANDSFDAKNLQSLLSSKPEPDFTIAAADERRVAEVFLNAALG